LAATAGINVLGCLIAALALRYWPALNAGHSITRATVLITGFCGGLTTFSSAFAGPTMAWRAGHRGDALASWILTPLACCVAVFSVYAFG
jgi:fluoride ion exporter CrcB/FEX